MASSSLPSLPVRRKPPLSSSSHPWRGREVLCVRGLLNLLRVNTSEVDLLGSGDNVAGVDSAEGDTVNLEWASDEENTLVGGVQEDDTLATETASEEDENGTGGERCARSRGSDSLADLSCDGLIFGGIKLAGLLRVVRNLSG